jgi:hypothetical protein
MAQHTVVGQCLLIVEGSRSHSDTPHSIGLLWMGHQSDAETSNNIQQLQETDFHVPAGFETAIPASERP